MAGELDRITRTPGLMSGKACIRGMRVTVAMIVRQISAGISFDELLADYPTWNGKISRRHFDTPLCWLRNVRSA